ncbi:MAG: hypothetical protein E3J35_08930 [Methanomassiliicoccales archaeon]|nr:MAG: hypothetical protein E3J35_08930 [Methanomassiliicoccales archaeon]
MLPKVVLHKAVSLDGRTDNFEREILTELSIPQKFGINAVLADADAITRFVDLIPPEAWEEWEQDTPPQQMEDSDDPRPILVVHDSEGKVRNWDKIRKLPMYRRHLALGCKSTPQEYHDYLKENNIEHITTGDEQIDIKAALSDLNEHCGVKVVILDSEGDLNSKMIREGLVDEVSLIVYPTLVGGEQQRAFFYAEDLTTPEDAIGLRLKDHDELGRKLIWLHYSVIKRYAEQKEMGEEAINEFAELMKGIQSMDDFKEKREKIFEFVEHLLISTVESLKRVVNNPPPPEQIQERIARIEKSQELLTEVFEDELDRIAKLPGDSGYVGELRSLMDSRFEPYGEELGELMERLMSLMGEMSRGLEE